MADEEEDRISELPDCILLIILSFVGCTKQVFRTSLLSKRWQFLWIDVSRIDLVCMKNKQRAVDFYFYGRKISSFMDLVTKMLCMRRSETQLNKFSVDFRFEQCFANKVDGWVDYATKNKVENIELICRGGDHYLLPQTLYSHSSLTSLSLRRCHITPRGAAIKWVCLKNLFLYSLELSHSSMEYILSGCPVLEVLSLSDCRGHQGECYTLSISLPCLKTLIFEKWCGNDECEILAPYVLNLTVRYSHRPMNFKLTNVSSVVRASLDLNTGNPEHLSLFDFKELLESLKFVKELELGTWFIEVLSVNLEDNDDIKVPQFTQLRCLTINAHKENDSIPGIIAILESAPNLETLFIKGEDATRFSTYDWYVNMDFVPSHLKSVKITNFIGDKAGEPMLTLVQLLLKKAKVLEKMVISAKGLNSHLLSSADLIKISDKLQNFPRASREARVEFHK